jgi:putative DNA primase/helicase
MLTAGEIAVALGGKRTGSNSFVVRCPAHEDKSPSLSLSDVDGLVLWHCHAGCTQRDVRDALAGRGLWPRPGDAGEPTPRAKPRQAKPRNNEHWDFAGKIWCESVDPRGTLAEQYLRGRGLELDDDLCGRVLRFHGRCPFGKDEKDKRVFVPALVVAFRPIRNDDETRPPVAIHRIGLKPDGSKIDKMMLGPVGGAAVKLDADDAVEEGLGICEGIETGLAIRAAGWRPIWALGSAGAIEKFAPVPGIEHLTIFADHDKIDPKTGRPPGPAAARECAHVWQAAGCEVVIRTPRSTGADWLDLQP